MGGDLQLGGKGLRLAIIINSMDADLCLLPGRIAATNLGSLSRASEGRHCVFCVNVSSFAEHLFERFISRLPSYDLGIGAFKIRLDHNMIGVGDEKAPKVRQLCGTSDHQPCPSGNAGECLQANISLVRGSVSSLYVVA